MKTGNTGLNSATLWRHHWRDLFLEWYALQ